jgi:Zn-dependent peptidase ImmA (M78 family)
MGDIKSVQIGFYTWSITFRTEPEGYGSSSSNHKSIVIANQYPLQVQRETLMHEILHAIQSEMDLVKSLKDLATSEGDDDSIEDKMEERINRALSPNICQVFNDNPLVANFILGRT